MPDILRFDDSRATRFASRLKRDATGNLLLSGTVSIVVLVVCFSHSSLSSVTPPDIWYALKLPQEVINYCYLSALQVEAVVYACQQHETFLADSTRAGFLIGNKNFMLDMHKACHFWFQSTVQNYVRIALIKN